MLSVLCAMSGCASLPFIGQQPASAPVTPVFFQLGSTALDGPAQTAIQAAAEAAINAPGASVVVTGASDGVGSPAAEDAVAEARAQAVAAALEKDGVEPDRIKIRNAGDAMPAGAAGEPAQLARRVMIRIEG